MNHSFNVEVAQKYGIEEAILLENLFWWCEKNRANGKHIVNGRAWTYNSAKAYAELFPYMSPAKIRRVLISMEEQGLIYSDCFNENKYDQTKWYTLTDLANAFYKNVKSSEQKCEITITDIKPNKKPVKNTNTPTLEEIEQFCKERGNGVDAKRVFDYYSSANWKDGRGNPVRNWKQKIIAVWEKPKEESKIGKVAHEREVYDKDFNEDGSFRW